MSILNLSKQYIHMGVVMGPGPIDVQKRMKEAGHTEEVQKQAHEMLSRSVKDFDEKEKKGLNPELAPISYELDGPQNDQSNNTTQRAANAPAPKPTVQAAPPTAPAE